MVGKAIKYLRKNKNLKQEQLAKFMNIDQTTLSSYETERRHVDFETIEKIANKCNYNIYFINNKTGDKFQLRDLERRDI